MGTLCEMLYLADDDNSRLVAISGLLLSRLVFLSRLYERGVKYGKINPLSTYRKDEILEEFGAHHQPCYPPALTLLRRKKENEENRPRV